MTHTAKFGSKPGDSFSISTPGCSKKSCDFDDSGPCERSCASTENEQIVQVHPSIVIDDKPLELTDIDFDMVSLFLEHLDIGDEDPVIFSCYGVNPESDKKDGRFFPKKSGQRYNWDNLVEWQAQHPGSRPWNKIKSELTASFRNNLGIVSSPGGASHVGRGEILGVRCLIYEIDDQRVSLAEQETAWIKAGLPQPSLMVDTSNRGYHIYYVLNEICSCEEGKNARIRLSKTVEAALEKDYPGIKTDYNLHSVSQVTRLPGSVHPKTRKRVTIENITGLRYTLAELNAVLLPLDQPTVLTVGAGGNFTVKPGPDPEWYEQFADFSSLPPVPLELALAKGTKDLLINGMDPKSDERWKKCWQLSKHLRAGRLHLESIGCTVEDAESVELDLLNDFVVKSEMKGGDTNLVLSEHYRPDPCGESDLPDTFLKRAVSSWAERNRFWKPTYEWSGKPALAEKDSGPDQWLPKDPHFWLASNAKTCELVIESAICVRNQFYGTPMLCHQNRFYQYDPTQGCWLNYKRSDLLKFIADLLFRVHKLNQKGQRTFGFTTARTAKNCVEWLATTMDNQNMELEDAIAFSNGTYLIRDKRFVPHDPEFRLLYSIQGDFNPDQTECPPAMRQFIVSSFGEEYIRPIQMVLRYMVDLTLPPLKIVTLVGPSRSGKGVFERLIEKFYPPSCVSAITSSIGVINSPEKVRQHVSGKKLVAFPDIQGLQKDVTTLYSLVDGGLISDRALFENETDAAPFNGRVIICSSQAPQFENAGSGAAGRALTLQTLAEVKDKDPDLNSKLESEIGSIVSWALQADWQEVKDMLYHPDDTFLEAQFDVERGMDVVREFLDNSCEPCGGDEMPKDSDLYAAFKQFCKDFNYEKVQNRKKVLTRIRQALPNLTFSRKAVPGTNSAKKTREQLYGFRVISEVQLSDGTAKYREGNWPELKKHKPSPPSIESVVRFQSLAD
jgi:phage/plasmid-associated DNA primase